jgi:hypothetical protein
MLISQDPTLTGLQKAQAIEEIHRRQSGQNGDKTASPTDPSEIDGGVSLEFVRSKLGVPKRNSQDIVEHTIADYTITISRDSATQSVIDVKLETMNYDATPINFKLLF